MGNKPALLIVDDDINNLITTKAVLESLDIKIDFANSGPESIQLTKKNEYFLILMDIQMPKMSGFEAVSLIREIPTCKYTPIIFITAVNKDDKYVALGYEKGAIDYLFKPVKYNLLLSKVSAFLNIYEDKRLSDEFNQKLIDYDKMVAHDLKGPLASIIMLSESLNRNFLKYSTPKDQKALNSVRSESQRAIFLIDDLLHFTCIENDSNLLETVNLQECIDDTITNMRYQISQEKTILTRENVNIQIQGNPIRLQQLFRNLISNAIKYHKINKVAEIKIYGINDTKNKIGKIVIEDNGVGFLSENPNEIFEPLKRLHKDTQYKGNGIGLAICKKIAEYHDWAITAESHIGHGTKIILSLK